MMADSEGNVEYIKTASDSKLTLDSLLTAIRLNLIAAADGPAMQLSTLNLYGVPGDATMRQVLANAGGRLHIVVQEIPQPMTENKAPSNAELYRMALENRL